VTDLRPSTLAPGLLLGSDVYLAEGVTIGANVVIHDQVVVEEGSTIQDGAVIGKRPILGPNTRAAPPAPDATTRLARGCAVGAYAILVAGSQVEEDAVIGDRAFVREHATVGSAAVVGGGCQIGSSVAIGARAKLMNNMMNNTLIARGTVVEEDVFCGPAVTTTNDMTLGRHLGPEEIHGAMLRRACRIGACVLILPGIEIGAEAFVGAGSLVTRDVPARTLAMGSPARRSGRSATTSSSSGFRAASGPLRSPRVQPDDLRAGRAPSASRANTRARG
jgi:UDP-2-acetamido-3-amino-2,3-dideoxy-glucuronate N-acetyltransferase